MMGTWNGKKMTLDTVMPVAEVKMQPRRVENAMGAGFRAEWLSGAPENAESPVKSFDLAAGAGLGSPWMILTVEMTDGTDRVEVVDMREVAHAWIASVIAGGPTPKENEDG